MAPELPLGQRPENKAAHTLQEAPRSPCPHCGRETATVSGGVCADCWGVKDPENAIVFRAESKNEPLFDWEAWLPDGVGVALLVKALLVAVLVAVGVLLGLR